MARLCEHPDCDNPHRAKGYCNNHYRLKYGRGNETVTLDCVICGATVTRHKYRSDGRLPTCSSACRSAAQHGLRSDLPADHWARWYGKTSRWSAPAVQPARFISGSCGWCGDWFILDRKANQNLGGGERCYCSARCGKRAGRRQNEKTRRAAYAAGDRGLHWRSVARRDGLGCWLCGGVSDPEDYTLADSGFIAGPTYPSLDHVIPLGCDGTHTFDNAAVAHMRCNSLKSLDTVEVQLHLALA